MVPVYAIIDGMLPRCVKEHDNIFLYEEYIVIN